ncbi:unnamed protein product [Echinostoma caproni]|uniref:Neuropeptide-Like Protein n=1 Tax=Echinostoma caproni TaxID=27848 RepID=A0A183BEL1_9TREM|nr:unnamed protein product [Echinostoma caproni]
MHSALTVLLFCLGSFIVIADPDIPILKAYDDIAVPVRTRVYHLRTRYPFERDSSIQRIRKRGPETLWELD